MPTLTCHTRLPATISWAESTTALGRGSRSPLVHPGAAEKRHAEFSAGRALISELSGPLGYGRTPLGRRPDGAPDWPAGLTGSISHCPGYRVVVLAPSTVHPALGVDAEPLQLLQPETFTFISTACEQAQVERLRHRLPPFPWCRLLFTAKEAVYKACTSTGHRPTWTQCQVDLGADGTTVSPSVITGTTRVRFGGCWSIRAGHHGPIVRTVVWALPGDDPLPAAAGEHKTRVTR